MPILLPIFLLRLIISTKIQINASIDNTFIIPPALQTPLASHNPPKLPKSTGNFPKQTCSGKHLAGSSAINATARELATNIFLPQQGTSLISNLRDPWWSMSRVATRDVKYLGFCRVALRCRRATPSFVGVRFVMDARGAGDVDLWIRVWTGIVDVGGEDRRHCGGGFVIM